jgi:hypothetical protein
MHYYCNIVLATWFIAGQDDTTQISPQGSLLMQKDILIEMLTEASGKSPIGATFDFTAQQKTSILVHADGPIISIEEVTQVEVKEGYIVVRAGKNDMLLLRIDHILGMRLQGSRREGAGFLA